MSKPELSIDNLFLFCWCVTEKWRFQRRRDRLRLWLPSNEYLGHISGCGHWVGDLVEEGRLVAYAHGVALLCPNIQSCKIFWQDLMVMHVASRFGVEEAVICEQSNLLRHSVRLAGHLCSTGSWGGLYCPLAYAWADICIVGGLPIDDDPHLTLSQEVPKPCMDGASDDDDSLCMSFSWGHLIKGRWEVYYHNICLFPLVVWFKKFMEGFY